MAKRQRHAMRGYPEVGASWRRDPWHTAYYQSLRVEDGVAISYSTPIAEVIEGVDGKKYMLETTQKHSPTTTRHQSNLRRPECCDGGVIRAMRVGRYCMDHTAHMVNLRHMRETYWALVSSGRRALPASWRFEWYITRRQLLSELYDTRNNALAYITAFGLDPEAIEEMQPTKHFNEIIAHHADRGRNEKLARQRRLAHERRKNKLMLAMLTGEMRHDPNHLRWIDERYESAEVCRKQFMAEFADTLAQGDNHPTAQAA